MALQKDLCEGQKVHSRSALVKATTHFATPWLTRPQTQDTLRSFSSQSWWIEDQDGDVDLILEKVNGTLDVFERSSPSDLSRGSNPFSDIRLLLGLHRPQL